LWRLALVAVLCLILASPAYAAENIYMSVEGVKQGKFKGEPGSPSGAWVPVLQVKVGQAGQPLLDTATTIARGNRQREQIKITKESGAASPQFHLALATKEVLREVVFEYFHPDPKGSGKNVLFYRIILTNAEIAGIQKTAGGAVQSAKELEQISFTYQKMEVVTSPGGAGAKEDTWTKK
jgi:type VI secretion system Hcp family effector